MNKLNRIDLCKFITWIRTSNQKKYLLWHPTSNISFIIRATMKDNFHYNGYLATKPVSNSTTSSHGNGESSPFGFNPSYAMASSHRHYSSIPSHLLPEHIEIHTQNNSIQYQPQKEARCKRTQAKFKMKILA